MAPQSRRACTIILAVTVLTFGCSRKERQEAEVARRVAATNLLRDCCKLILIQEDFTKTDAPHTPAELLQWLGAGQQDPVLKGRVANNGTAILDDWSSPIVVISHDGELVGFGSAGPNRVWEQARNDDITVYIVDLVRQVPQDANASSSPSDENAPNT